LEGKGRELNDSSGAVYNKLNGLDSVSTPFSLLQLYQYILI
jgi:hypothetical protein